MDLITIATSSRCKLKFKSVLAKIFVCSYQVGSEPHQHDEIMKNPIFSLLISPSSNFNQNGSSSPLKTRFHRYFVEDAAKRA